MGQSRDQLGLDFDVQWGEQRECEGLSSACAMRLGLFSAAAGGPWPSLALFLLWGSKPLQLSPHGSLCTWGQCSPHGECHSTPKVSDFLAPRVFWLFWPGICKLNAGYCAGRLAGRLSMATLPIHKAPYGFFWRGREWIQQQSQPLFVVLFVLVECGELETLSAGSWAWLVLAMAPRGCR